MDSYDYPSAQRVLELAIAGVRAFAAAHPDRVQTTSEVNVLLQRLGELRADMPTTEIGRVQRQLDDAVAREDYEAAVVLRDRLELLASESLPSFWD
ncbi:MAG: UvrB/UvrC motif-containing protein [Armatimonadetes bacterium]|nr:UvrB/UvrC motif-containing protein [Armatimonadota bacterium]